MNALPEVKNLSISFYPSSREENPWRLDQVCFQVPAQKTLAIVGESGSGKSVTAQSILRLQDPKIFQEFEGEILFNGLDLLTIGEKQMRKIRGNRISMIFQDPMTSLNPTHTIFKQVSEPIFLHQKSASTKKAKERVSELLEKVGLRNPESFFSRFPHELSGGERQRVMIAMAIANHPQLLIADEPTTALDVTIQAKIIALLKDLQKELGLTLLFITHDLHLARDLADRILVMKDGRVVEENTPKDLIENPRATYTKELFQSTPEPLSERRSVSDFILKVDSLNVSYPIRSSILKRKIGEVRPVKNISFELPKGRTLGVIGESGSGKTSLIMAILRLIESRGKIEFDGKRIDILSANKIKPLRKSLQVIFQDSFSCLNPRFSIGENAGEGLEIHEFKLSRAEKEDRIAETLRDVGLSPDIKDRFPHELSGGQRQRVNIARALILKPKVLLLDEPTSSLDVSLQKQIIDLLLRLQETKNLSYIFISHDLRVIRAISDRILVMKQGEVIEIFDNRELFSADRNPYTQSLFQGIKDTY